MAKNPISKPPIAESPIADVFDGRHPSESEKEWAEKTRPIEPLLGSGEDIKDRDGFQVLCQELL